MLKQGQTAPDFTLPDSQGKTVKLADFLGKNIVLYFYPRDNTPGCTQEAKDFRDALAKLKKKNTVVLGVSKDSIDSHCKFAEKFDLNFPLLSDPEGKTIQAYGAWGTKSMYGKTFKGIIRSTVIIDAQGKVLRVFPKVRVKDHVNEILATLEKP